jgi:hypothetical protein
VIINDDQPKSGSGAQISTAAGFFLFSIVAGILVVIAPSWMGAMPLVF